MATKLCNHCKSPFSTYHRNKVFCSPRCAGLGKTVEITPALVRSRWEAYVVRGDSDACWLWQGPKLVSGGYGVLQLGRRYKQRAHRVSYELHTGIIPAGMHVCHSCDTPACVNPNHLWLGTNRQNQADKMQKGRWVNVYEGRQQCSAGHPYSPENTEIKNGRRRCKECKKITRLASYYRRRQREGHVVKPRSHFSAESLEVIRNSSEPQSVLAKRFGASQSMISDIRARRKKWAHR